MPKGIFAHCTILHKKLNLDELENIASSAKNIHQNQLNRFTIISFTIFHVFVLEEAESCAERCMSSIVPQQPLEAC